VVGELLTFTFEIVKRGEWDEMMFQPALADVADVADVATEPKLVTSAAVGRGRVMSMVAPTPPRAWPDQLGQDEDRLSRSTDMESIGTLASVNRFGGSARPPGQR
jgi:hypothetical protein